MNALRRPALALLIALAGIVAAVAGAAIFSRNLPQLGLEVRSAPGTPIFIEAVADAPPNLALPATLIGVADGENLVTLDGDADAPRRSERGLNPGAIAVQNAALATVASGTAKVILHDRRDRTVTIERTVRPRSLGLSFWLAAVPGAVGAAVGFWVLAIRPRAAEARAVALSGTGLLLAALPFGVLTNAEMLVGGSMWHALVVTNWASAQVYGAGLIACFLTFPTALGTPSRRRAAYALLAATVPLVAVPTALLVANLSYVSAFVLADFVCIVIAVFMQWRRARRDPGARAALRLIGGMPWPPWRPFCCFTCLVWAATRPCFPTR